MFVSVVLAVGLSAASTNDLFVETRLAAYVPKIPQCLSRFLDYPPGPGKLGFPRCLWENPFPSNPDFWLKDVDFTCASPWNDSYGTQRAGTAISKRHIIFAKHFPMATGTRIAFVGENGDTSHYSIKAVKTLPSCDIAIGLLDYELTPDVHPAKILPVGFENWVTNGMIHPIVTFNQREELFLSVLSASWNDRMKKTQLCNRAPTNPTWQKFSGSIIVGDSGDPAFMIYNKRAILLYCLLSGGVGHGPFIHERRREIQQTMDDLSPGYKLETFDFTSQ